MAERLISIFTFKFLYGLSSLVLPEFVEGHYQKQIGQPQLSFRHSTDQFHYPFLRLKAAFFSQYSEGSHYSYHLPCHSQIAPQLLKTSIFI